MQTSLDSIEMNRIYFSLSICVTAHRLRWSNIWSTHEDGLLWDVVLNTA